jgi:dTDP-4-dehydrorhamnose 3,5-epimerase
MIIKGLEFYERNRLQDERGFFMELWKDDHSIPHTFKQDNISHSKFGTLRGLHFQKEPMAQGKLVSVIMGSVWDVVVDIRKDSNTFGEWYGLTLSDINNTVMYVPPGFAHGFLTLSPYAIFHYKCTEVYSKEYEDAIVWNDPTLAISWPIKPLFVSKKDAGAKTFD